MSPLFSDGEHETPVRGPTVNPQIHCMSTFYAFIFIAVELT